MVATRLQFEGKEAAVSSGAGTLIGESALKGVGWIKARYTARGHFLNLYLVLLCHVRKPMRTFNKHLLLGPFSLREKDRMRGEKGIFPSFEPHFNPLTPTLSLGERELLC